MTDPAGSLIILNPVGAQRASNPACLGHFNAAGQLVWVLPVDRARLVTSRDQSDLSEARFSGWWKLASQLPRPGISAVWQPGVPVGNGALEIGSTGTRPKGHPWVSLGCPTDALHLVAPMSARAELERSYQAWFDCSELRDATGGALGTKSGVLNSADGAVELAHFAVVDPYEGKWLRVGGLAGGPERARGSAHVLNRFQNAWPQRYAGRVVAACVQSASANLKCDACAGRP